MLEYPGAPKRSWIVQTPRTNTRHRRAALGAQPQKMIGKEFRLCQEFSTSVRKLQTMQCNKNVLYSTALFICFSIHTFECHPTQRHKSKGTSAVTDL